MLALLREKLLDIGDLRKLEEVKKLKKFNKK